MTDCIDYLPTNKHYTIHEKLTRAEAQGFKDRRKKLATLYYDATHSTNEAEQTEIWIEYTNLNYELEAMLALVLRKCLHLTPEEVDGLRVLEFTELGLELVEYSLK